jgi:P2 phage tail completion protein R (GpR)
MSKLQKLRDAVMAATTPRPLEADQVFTYVDQAKVSSSPTHLRYEGTVFVFVLDIQGAAHPIIKAVADYLRAYEPDAAKDALSFDVDVVDHNVFDIKITVPYTENVVFDGTAWEACAAPVPDPDAFLR